MAVTCPHLRLSSYVPRDGWYHIAGGTYVPGLTHSPHTHDFPELAWVTGGRGVHRINDTVQSIGVGSVLFIRATDRHTFVALSDTLDVVNLAFGPAVLADLARRYRNDMDWPWHDSELPRQLHCTEEHLLRMTVRARRLDAEQADRQRRVALDRFLINVLDDMSTSRSEQWGKKLAGAPDWLGVAVKRIQTDPSALAGGAPAFVKLTHKSREHVCRVLRDKCGLTPTQLINDLRMKHAARDLRMTSKPLIDVAMDAGYQNLGHFYHVFGKHFGTTPRRYRLTQQAILRGD